MHIIVYAYGGLVRRLSRRHVRIQAACQVRTSTGYVDHTESVYWHYVPHGYLKRCRQGQATAVWTAASGRASTASRRKEGGATLYMPVQNCPVFYP